MPKQTPPSPPPCRVITSSYRDVSHLHEPEATLAWNRIRDPDYELPKLTLWERIYCWVNNLSYPK